MRHAMRALRLNLERWAEDYPVATVVVGVILASGAFFGLLAIAHGCEAMAKAEGLHRRDAENAEKDRSSGKEAMGGCGTLCANRPSPQSIDQPVRLGVDLTPVSPMPGRSKLCGQPPICFTSSLESQACRSAVAPAGSMAPPYLAAESPSAIADGLGGPRLLFDALFAHESVSGTILVGDNGKSRGPYHIQRAYWKDGGGDPKAYDRLVDDRAACEKVMLAYFRRYEPEALAQGDYETLARLHNGGPTWRAKPATLAYWRKVKAHL